MNITIFTNNKPRHFGLVNKLSKKNQCYVISEYKKENFNSKKKKKKNLKDKYFLKVNNSEKKIFKNDISFKKYKKLISINYGDLSKLNKSFFKECLKSDLFIVFGSSYIKGWLARFLIKKKTLNLHMGISPYYRGSACNFWALYDKNPQFVGATIHYLSEGLDDGDILFHVLPSKKYLNTFDFTMSAVNSAQKILVREINNKKIFKINSQKQNNTKEIRYSKNKDFNSRIISNFNKQKINLNISYKKKSYINPFFDK